jgi:hypothetical protein
LHVRVDVTTSGGRPYAAGLVFVTVVVSVARPLEILVVLLVVVIIPVVFVSKEAWHFCREIMR